MSSKAILKRLDQKGIKPESLVKSSALKKGKIELSSSGAKKLNQIAKEVGSKERFMKGQGQSGTGFFSDFAKGFAKGFKSVITAPVKAFKAFSKATGLKAKDVADIASTVATARGRPDIAERAQKVGAVGTRFGLGHKGKGITNKGWTPTPYSTASVAGVVAF